MSRLARRRVLGALGFLVLLLTGWGAHTLLEVSLRRASFWSGWLLLALVVGLATWNVRKKLLFLPLGRGVAWMNFHAWAGLLCVAVFLAHVGFELPSGGFEVLLALVFVWVSASGLIGLGLSRALPGRLSSRGEEVVYERIPVLRRQLHEAAQALALDSTREEQTETLAEFYLARLAPFFAGARNLGSHWMGSRRPYAALAGEIDALGRLASAREREALARIGELVRRKDDLDYQHALQLALKGWLFLHVPVSYALLLLAAVHVLLVLGFRGGAP